eukprot:Skav202179  [mRNA]  locus=scaffold3078:179121:191066:- [translate_table: standard]
MAQCTAAIWVVLAMLGSNAGDSSNLVKASRAGRAFRRNITKPRQDGIQWPQDLARDTLTSIAIYNGHDASIAIATGSRIHCVLELERLFGRRYFYPRDDNFSAEWTRAAEVVRDRCECQGPCPREFDIGIIPDYVQSVTLPGTQLSKVVERVFRVKAWRTVNHHESHALMAYHSSPFHSALIVSFDGGGNDGTFTVFVGQGLDVYRVGRHKSTPVNAYTRLASYLPAVTGVPEDLQQMCNTLNRSEKAGRQIDHWGVWTIHFGVSRKLAFAGKLMGYSGIKTPSTEMAPWIRQFYQRVTSEQDYYFPTALLRYLCRSEEDRQIMAATVQDEFSKFLQPKVAQYLFELRRQSINVEGIVLVGGGALNVLLNQVIRETLASSAGQMEAMDQNPRDVYIPPGPGDSGLTIGAIWSVVPPTGRHQPLQYLGFRLFDEETLEDEAHKREAQRLSDLGGVEYLAELFAGGPAWQKEPRKETPKPVVRGRSEFGPRALGHRSLLAFPDSQDMRDRMNRIKFREWWRPAAPMIAEEALEYVFGHTFRSRYMEFAPRVREEVRQRFVGLSHFDGTARHQSVAREDEPWLHALLLAVGRRTGLAALINTSFNSRGKPICNTVKESLEMLDTLEGLDFLLIEDWLFRAPAVRKAAQVHQRRSYGVAVMSSVTFESCEVPHTRRLLLTSRGVRQFEYHPLRPSTLLVGMKDGTAGIIDYDTDVMTHNCAVDRFPILGLSWFHTLPTWAVVGGSQSGVLRFLRYDEGQPGSMHSVEVEAFQHLSSLSMNCTDDFFMTSGFCIDVGLYDVITGQRLLLRLRATAFAPKLRRFVAPLEVSQDD